MDQLKIGRFISQRRKEVHLTQSQLAEKLGITDRAVSKWETGKSLPDASIMLELCGILKISVNDLLSGEVVRMDEYNKELEKKLLEMIKQKEESDKRLLTMEWVIGGLALIILFVPIFISAFATLPECQRLLIMFSGFPPAIVGFALTMKVEQVAGYYACKLCGHRYVPELKAMYWAPHMGRTRWMTCPECGRKSWQKKVLNKESTDA